MFKRALLLYMSRFDRARWVAGALQDVRAQVPEVLNHNLGRNASKVARDGGGGQGAMGPKNIRNGSDQID